MLIPYLPYKPISLLRIRISLKQLISQLLQQIQIPESKSNSNYMIINVELPQLVVYCKIILSLVVIVTDLFPLPILHLFINLPALVIQQYNLLMADIEII